MNCKHIAKTHKDLHNHVYNLRVNRLQVTLLLSSSPKISVHSTFFKSVCTDARIWGGGFFQSVLLLLKGIIITSIIKQHQALTW